MPPAPLSLSCHRGRNIKRPRCEVPEKARNPFETHPRLGESIIIAGTAYRLRPELDRGWLRLCTLSVLAGRLL